MAFQGGQSGSRMLRPGDHLLVVRKYLVTATPHVYSRSPAQMVVKLTKTPRFQMISMPDLVTS